MRPKIKVRKKITVLKVERLTKYDIKNRAHYIIHIKEKCRKYRETIRDTKMTYQGDRKYKVFCNCSCVENFMNMKEAYVYIYGEYGITKSRFKGNDGNYYKKMGRNRDLRSIVEWVKDNPKPIKNPKAKIFDSGTWNLSESNYNPTLNSGKNLSYVVGGNTSKYS